MNITQKHTRHIDHLAEDSYMEQYRSEIMTKETKEFLADKLREFGLKVQAYPNLTWAEIQPAILILILEELQDINKRLGKDV